MFNLNFFFSFSVDPGAGAGVTSMTSIACAGQSLLHFTRASDNYMAVDLGFLANSPYTIFAVDGKGSSGGFYGIMGCDHGGNTNQT